MNKGDRVLVHAVINTSYGEPQIGAELVHKPASSYKTKKCLYRITVTRPWLGLVMGTSYRATGYYHTGSSSSFRFDDDYPEPPELDEDKRHPVIMVQSLSTQRWLRPVACLEQDLEIVQEMDK